MKFYFTPLKVLTYILILFGIYNAINSTETSLGLFMVLFTIPVLFLFYLLSVIICKSKMSFIKIIMVELIIAVTISLVIISAVVNS